jgi:hypothetical protein
VGALLGLVVAGIGGQLAMMLLARLNPEATGVTSDDGLTIGQFTVSDTLTLLLLGTLLRLVGAGVYAPPCVAYGSAHAGSKFSALAPDPPSWSAP